MKNVSLLALLLVASQLLFSQSPPFAWANSIGGVGDEYAVDMTTDTAGNVYITGAFSGAVDFDPGATVYTQYSVLLRDAYVAKYNTNGEFVWAKTMGGNYHDGGSCVVTDVDGNVYVGGSFVNTVDFDPGLEVFNLTSAGTMNTPDMFLLKLDANGDFVSAFNLGSDGYDSARDLALDIQGNLYIAGLFYDTVNFGLVDGTSVNLTANGNNDIYVSKFSNAGVLKWAKSFGSIASDSESAVSLGVDVNGNVFTCGSFPFSVDFDTSEDEFNVTSNGNSISSDIFIHKLDSTGNFMWVKTVGSTGPDGGYAIELDADGNILVTGLFTNTVDFDPNSDVANLITATSWTPYVLKLDNNGNYEWAKSFIGPSSGIGQGIATDVYGNVYTTGFFRETKDFDPGSNEYILTAEESEVYISKLSPDGDFIFAKALGGSSFDQGTAIELDSQNNVFTVGEFDVDGNFNSDTLQVFELTSSGFSDVFIHKMGDNTQSTTELLTGADNLLIYPNPALDFVQISYPVLLNFSAIDLLNPIGKVCYSNYSFTQSGKLALDIRNLETGMYFVSMTAKGGEQMVSRFVKE